MANILDDFKLLERHGFKLLPYTIAKTESEAIKIAERIKYPVVLKVVSSEISHKTDIGGVKVGIRNQNALLTAYRDILENCSGKKIDGILVQKMARKGVELIIGGKTDAQFGHVIVLGLGGVYVEVFRDITARICPINKQDVNEMIMELKAHPLIKGVRGKAPININSLERILFTTCKFLEKEHIKEMDLNPVIFDDKGGDITDVRLLR